MRFIGVLLGLVMLTSSCYLPYLKKDAETIVREKHEAVLHMVYAERSSCTAFHIGDGLFVSAAHCLAGYPAEPLGEILLTDEHNFKYNPKLVGYDSHRDLILLHLDRYSGEKLELWDSFWDGKMPLGMDLIGLGFPGYFGLDFTFDPGQLKGVVQDDSGLHYILSRELSMPGYSGGPILSMHNGKVVGITHVMVDQTHYFDEAHHVHAWISLAISVEELQNWLRELKLR